MVITTETRRLFTVEEYHRMLEAGILTPDDRVELIEGEILGMAPIGSSHAACVRRLDRIFQRAADERFLVSAQCPIALLPRSEPQPDLALLRPRDDAYAAGHPQPNEIFLVIEIGDSSAGFDRRVKVRLYARAGLAEVWLVDVGKQRVEIYRNPSPEGYQVVRRVRPGHKIAPLAFPEVMVPVEDIFGVAKSPHRPSRQTGGK